MALIENYVGDTVPARDRNESLTAVLNIKNFIGNLMKHGKRDKIQLHTLSIIGTACYGGIVSKRSLMRLLGLGSNVSKTSRNTRLAMERIVVGHNLNGAIAANIINNTSINGAIAANLISLITFIIM